MKIFTAEQMRAFDRAATEEYHIPSIVLMENAALRVVEFLEMKFGPLVGKGVDVFCGKGNNGGDGFAIARHLATSHCRVRVLLTCQPKDLTGDAAINYQMLCSAGHDVDVVQLTKERFSVRPNVAIVIDAVLGTGFKGKISEKTVKGAIEWLRLLSCPIVSVDIPSGVNADTGEADAAAVRANFTVTFAAPKRGMFLRDGIEHTGEVWIGSIGTPALTMETHKIDCIAVSRSVARLHSSFLHRSLDAHKGTAGRVVVIGGSYGMSGAPTLASRAVLRAGAGLCITCLPDKVLPTFAAGFLEATSHPLPCDEKGRLIPDAFDALPDIWKGAQVVAIGPGISRSPETLEFVRRVVRECPLPTVIDADALYALREIESDVHGRSAPTILTPHPGEMGELMQMPVKEVNESRFETATACAQKYNAIVVLKGARSIVATPDGSTFVNLTGNAGMATGGSGDVLTGTIAGLLAQLDDAQSATLAGVYLHGLAGDLVYQSKGNGLIAGDIAEALPHALVELAKPSEAPANARLRKLE